MSEDGAHKPGRVINERPGPRVIVEIDGRVITRGLAERLFEVVPTLVGTDNLSKYNLNEWDCVITCDATATLDTENETGSSGWDTNESVRYVWRDGYPAHLSVITVIEPADRQWSTDTSFLAFDPPSGKSPEPPTLCLLAESGVVGTHLALPTDLPEKIERLVRRELIPVAEERSFHRIFRHGGDRSADPDALAMRPFLYGPDDCVLAGSLERNGQASLWFLPGDLPDVFPWVIAALNEWHHRYPKRFPALPDWGSTDEWQTADEARITGEIDANAQWFHDQYKVYDERDQALSTELTAARSRADRYERALLTSDGRMLEGSVSCALAELGFIVVDMDEIWPEGQRKEDLRIVDPEVDDWLAIVEIKGFSNGVKETGFTSLGRWGQFYVLETGSMPSASWYVANGFKGDDPTTRPEPYAGRGDALDVVEESGGLVIDTRALFDLVRAVRENPDRAAVGRRLLRESTRLLVRCPAQLLDQVPEGG